MCNSRRHLTVLWVVLFSATLPGCATQPRSTYPVLEQTVASDADLDCAGFDDGLLNANAIRDAIHEEHGDVINAVLLSAALDVSMVPIEPVSGMLLGMLDALVASKAIKAYVEAATAAELRME
jgi:hypothetical protein